MRTPYNLTLLGTQFKNNIKRKDYRSRLRSRTLAMPIRSRKSLRRVAVYTYLPPFWKLTITTKVNNARSILLTFSSPTYFFKLPLPNYMMQARVDAQSNLFTAQFDFINNYVTLYILLIRKLLYSFTRLFCNKLKFKGKGYYIYKNARNTVTPQFGHAHRIYNYAYNVSVKFLSKTTIFIYGLSSRDILKVSYGIKKMKPINIFTGRGVRFSKQIIYKKTGKVSSYR